MQETDIAVMYFDVENELGVEFRKSSINLHHFRSSTLKKEVVNTNECWLKCINKKEVIPAKMIKVYDDTDEKVIVNLNNLIYYKQPQICINNEKLLENPSEPSSSETILDNQELPSIEINQSFTSWKIYLTYFQHRLMNINFQILQILHHTVPNLNS